MAKKSVKKPTLSLIDLIVKGIQEKKGTNIQVIDLTEVQDAYADYFIICTGTSDTNVKAIADSIEEIVRLGINDKPAHIEGYQDANWILMDFFDTMVHIFKEEEREHYDLESLWADAKINHIPDNEETDNE